MTDMSEFHRRHDDDQQYLTRREAEVILENGVRAQEERLAAHAREHEADREAVELALTAANRQQLNHNEAHDKAHEAHAKEHEQETRAVETALAAVGREGVIHAEAHDREHAAHQREHVLVNLAVDKAESANDKRFDAANAYREQIDDILQTLTSRDAFDGHTREMDRRLEDLRAAVVELQKYDVRGEGRTKGQGMVIAAIVGAVSLVGTFLGIVIILANFATKG